MNAKRQKRPVPPAGRVQVERVQTGIRVEKRLLKVLKAGNKNRMPDWGWAVVRLAEERDSMRAALSLAREWELEVVAGRPSVHRRILDLIA